MISEIKAINIKTGNSYVLSDDIGKFKKGEKVTVFKLIKSGDDVELTLQNEQGVKDKFYLDKDDNFEELT